jgi:hypothetical protein
MTFNGASPSIVSEGFQALRVAIETIVSSISKPRSTSLPLSDAKKRSKSGPAVEKSL